MTKIQARVKDQNEVRARSAITVTRKIEDFTDVDTSNLENGSVFVYDTATSKWTSTRLLNQQDIDGGEY